MARNNQRGGNNNNPSGKNQYSNGWMDTARDRPMATAAAAAAAVGAGVFLWSRRNQISDQLSNLSDQVSGWREGMQSGDSASTDGNRSTASGSGTSSSRTSSGSASSRRSGGKSGRGSGAMDEIGIIEVDTVTL
jgi:hypothetical protein